MMRVREFAVLGTSSSWLLTLTLAGCQKAEQPAAARVEPDAVSSGAEPDVGAAVVLSDAAWPSAPEEDASWQTIRYETVHVRLAVPKGARVERQRMPYGHPSVVVVGAKGSVQITYSSGAGVFARGLGEEPPTVAGLPIERIERTPENTTVAYVVQGIPRVVGWVRGAECKVESLDPEVIDFGFSLCASMRVPKPGPLVEARPGAPFSAVPSDAVLLEDRVPLLYAGHFNAKRTPGPCASEAEIREHQGERFELEKRPGERGEILVGRAFSEYDGAVFPSTTSVWATRGGRCCVATIAEAITPPTRAQVDYVARLCDG
ncbi:MAG: hypothetical protein ACE37F_02725 [Nannocystaceae bacterium]|nr:hypothetical protein [bacterium]